MSSVTLRNLTKTFADGTVAVGGLSIDIADGELVVLVGPSGSGKSTTLRMIAGLDTPTSGDIEIGLRRMNDLPPDKRDVSMVFQDYALYPHMTARQNMTFGLSMRGAAGQQVEAQVQQVAESLGITPLLGRKPHQLSGGEQQRVALGRAIVRQPAVFLLDEPLANLDAQLRTTMRAELAALQRRLRTTMIHVTHDQVEAMTLGDRLVLLDRGVVQQIGPPLELYQRPANRFVATFLGSPTMNLVAGTIDGGVFHAASLRWPVATQHQGPALLGIRPEHLQPAREGEPVLTTAPSVLVERLGHETLVHFDRAGSKLVARLGADQPVSLHEPLPLTIRDHQGHLFADDSQGLALVD